MRKLLPAILALAAFGLSIGPATAKFTTDIQKDGWQLLGTTEACGLHTTFETKDHPIYLDLLYLPEKDAFNFVLTSKRYSKTIIGRRFWMTVTFDNTRTRLRVSGVETEDGPALGGYVGANFLKDFAETRKMELEVEGARLGTFNIDQPRDLVAKFVKCADDAWKAQFGKG